ncbi:M50 family metallopeptidase, partial [Alphaproteobacteria bacterium]|nr:M50 family metallopeptidase [Alphaproteobacteria bacterium]
MYETSFLTSFLGFFLVLTPLIFIHELGHYFAAIKSGVKVESFSIGFGPELIGFNDKNGTRWKFSLIPLGGYVKMKGELVNISNNFEKNRNDKDAFLNSSIFSRIFIVVSGPIANLVLGSLLITSIYVFNGRYFTPPIVEEVILSQPAMVAGIISGDEIISINDLKINEFNDIKNIVENSSENSLVFKILRFNSVITLNIIPSNYYDSKLNKNIGRIGIKASPTILKKLSILEAFRSGFFDSIQMTKEWLKGLKSLLLLNVDKKDILGPIGIAKVSGSSLNKGLFSVLFLMAVLSINLGLINLLPIPALDGGYLVLFMYELIFKKPLSSSIQIFLLKFGFIFLVSLMLL